MMMGFEILLVVGVIALVVWGVQQGWNLPGRRESTEAGTPLAILQGRFARGEIDREEFQERRAILEDQESKSG